MKEIPKGFGFGRAEAPRGEVFHFVKTDGSNSPVRHKVRAPSYVNIATFKKSCIGQTIADATIILAAVDPCYCCTERMAFAYDYYSGKQIMNGLDLIRISQQKTNEGISYQVKNSAWESFRIDAQWIRRDKDTCDSLESAKEIEEMAKTLAS